MEKHIAARRLRKTYIEPEIKVNKKSNNSTFSGRMLIAALFVIIVYLVDKYIPNIGEKYKIIGLLEKEYHKNYKIEELFKINTNTIPISVFGIYKEEPIKSVSVNSYNVDVSSIKDKKIYALPTSGVITSRFKEKEHTGIDIANKLGTNITSSIDGKVKKIYNDKFYGKTVEIENENITLRYAHLSKVFVKENEIVNKDKIIAQMGNTGNSTGPHLHFEILINNKQVNPEEIINELSKDKI